MKTFSEFNEEIQELTIGARQKRTASDRMAQKRDYRKNRAQQIQKMRRYRKTAGYKQLQRKAKIMKNRRTRKETIQNYTFLLFLTDDKGK